MCGGSLAAGDGSARVSATARRAVAPPRPSSPRCGPGGGSRFSCGPKHVTIRMRATAKVLNSRREVVLDGGGMVTLSGAGRRRILYMDTCDPAQVFTTSHCQDQATPRLVVENLTFADGNSSGEDFDGGGGGAIFARGGRLRIVHSTFVRNRCEPQRARRRRRRGARAVPIRRRPGGGGQQPVHRQRVQQRRRAEQHRGVVARGAQPVRRQPRDRAGANPARPGTPGGGSGGAIYNDGNRFTLTISSSHLADNHATEGGGAIFFVSNDRTGTLAIKDSVLQHNRSDGFQTAGLPGIFFLGAGPPAIVDSVLR